MRVVADASVVVKWVVPDPLAEPELDQAGNLLLAYRARRVELLEPPHWLAEVGAVLARLRPETVDSALDRVEAAARGTDNLLPIMKDAFLAGATLGQIVISLKRVFGEHRASV